MEHTINHFLGLKTYLKWLFHSLFFVFYKVRYFIFLFNINNIVFSRVGLI